MKKKTIFGMIMLCMLLFAGCDSRDIYIDDDSGFSIDFYMAVAQGKVPGHSAINKFGHNPATTSGDDVWAGTGVYDFYPTTAQSMQVVSDSIDDTLLGDGARTGIVYGHADNWSLQSETFNLNGTTPVLLTKQYRRMYRAVILTAGDDGTNAGNIEIEVVGGGSIGAYIGVGDGQTQQCIFTIPANNSGYFIQGYTGLADNDKNGEVAEFQWQARANNGVTGAWAVQGEIGLNNIGSSWWQYRYGVPVGPIPEKTDIRIKVIDSTTTLGTVCGFDMVLVEDGY